MSSLQGVACAEKALCVLR